MRMADHSGQRRGTNCLVLVFILLSSPVLLYGEEEKGPLRSPVICQSGCGNAQVSPTQPATSPIRTSKRTQSNYGLCLHAANNLPTAVHNCMLQYGAGAPSSAFIPGVAYPWATPHQTFPPPPTLTPTSSPSPSPSPIPSATPTPTGQAPSTPISCPNCTAPSELAFDNCYNTYCGNPQDPRCAACVDTALRAADAQAGITNDPKIGICEAQYAQALEVGLSCGNAEYGTPGCTCFQAAYAAYGQCLQAHGIAWSGVACFDPFAQ
jgi:hypothetical protein